MPDGKVVLVYKSTRRGHWPDGHFEGDLRPGVAMADNYPGPYRHVSEESILNFTGTKDSNAEDGYIWYDKSGFHLLCKVFGAGSKLIGEVNGGIHAVSKDGINWKLADNPKGYSRTIVWADGRKETMKRLERVQLLIEDGIITHAIFAIVDNSGNPDRNIVIPVKH